MSLPYAVKDYLKKVYNIIIDSETPVSGGSINRAYRIDTNQGELFLKFNTDTPSDFFAVEAKGLELLKSAETNLRIPEVVAVENSCDKTPGFLLMEYIEPDRSGNSKEFGAQLARLHQTKETEFGLDYDNYIGSLPQRNRKHDEWESFLSEERIKPQLKMAIDSGKMDQKNLRMWDMLSSKLNRLLPKTEPSLVHGDL